MDFTTIVIVVLILVAVGVFPAWPHARNWGYMPSAVAGFVLILLVIWALVRG